MELSLAMQNDHALSARRADRALALSRSARYYRPRVRDDSALIEAMQAHLKVNPGHGFGLLFDQSLHGKGWGKTRAWRVYVKLRLNFPAAASAGCPTASANLWKFR